MNNSGSEGCGWLIGILIVVVIVLYALVYVILPVTLVIIGGIAVVGACYGMFVAAKNFGQTLSNAHKAIK